MHNLYTFAHKPSVGKAFGYVRDECIKRWYIISYNFFARFILFYS